MGANKQTSGHTRETFLQPTRAHQSGSASEQQQIPLIGKSGGPPVIRATAGSAMDRNISRNSENHSGYKASAQLSSAQGMHQHGRSEGITPQKIAEFRSNREQTFRSKGGALISNNNAGEDIK